MEHVQLTLESFKKLDADALKGQELEAKLKERKHTIISTDRQFFSYFDSYSTVIHTDSKIIKLLAKELEKIYEENSKIEKEKTLLENKIHANEHFMMLRWRKFLWFSYIKTKVLSKCRKDLK